MTAQRGEVRRGDLQSGRRFAVGGRQSADPAVHLSRSEHQRPGTTTPVRRPQAIRAVFDWFFANGGPDLPLNGAPTIPGVTPQIADGLTSPSAWEVRGRRVAPVRRARGSCAPTCCCATTSTSTCGRPTRRRAACRIRPAARSTCRSSRTRQTVCCRATTPAERSPGPTASAAALDIGANYTLSRA